MPKSYPYFEEIIPDNKIDIAKKENISVLSWNIMGQRNSYKLEKRLPYIIDKIIKLNADLVFLQEITKYIYPIINEKLKHIYNISIYPGQQLCQITLSKYKFDKEEILYYNSNKNFMLSYWGIYCFVNIHLNSSRNPNAQNIRIEQIKTILSRVDTDKVMLIGDFNLNDFTMKDLFENIEELAKYTDINSDHTFDPNVNIIAKLEHPSGGEIRRFDRCWVRNISVENIDVVCKEIINIDGEMLNLSDHYALFGTIM